MNEVMMNERMRRLVDLDGVVWGWREMNDIFIVGEMMMDENIEVFLLLWSVFWLGCCGWFLGGCYVGVLFVFI